MASMKSISDKASHFISIVKKTFVNQPWKFDEFAKILTSLPAEQDRDHVISKLQGLFAGEPGLLSSLNEFVPEKYKPSVVNRQYCDKEDMVKEDDQPNKKKRKLDMVKEDDQPNKKKRKPDWVLRETPSEVFNRIRDRCVEKNDDEFRVLMEFSAIILSYREKKITYYEADDMFKKLFKDDPDLFLEANCVLAESLEKPVKISGWTGEKKRCVVVCSLQEETMDAKEFYLFEIGLVFSRLDSVIKKLEKPESLEDGLTALDFGCIKKLYDDSDDDHWGLGEDMLQILKSDSFARVVVLERLRAKKRQLEEQKLHLDKIWNEIFQDIRVKGRVQRHREFLRNTKKASINGFEF